MQTQPLLTLLLVLSIGYTIGSVLIDLRRKIGYRFFGQERRKVRKINELDPLGERMIAKTERMLTDDKLETREGVKFIMEMMRDIYISDAQKTLKVNEIVEQFEILRNKSITVWIQDHPKAFLFLMTLAFAWVTDEIRAPLIRQALNYLGINLP